MSKTTVAIPQITKTTEPTVNNNEIIKSAILHKIYEQMAKEETDIESRDHTTSFPILFGHVLYTRIHQLLLLILCYRYLNYTHNYSGIYHLYGPALYLMIGIRHDSSLNYFPRRVYVSKQMFITTHCNVLKSLVYEKRPSIE
uniref:Uncharacterized protein n=1 Tax=Heterorhabditis bacteriophora TaxID=37862 RepID=A0A1I7WGN8_HETBA